MLRRYLYENVCAKYLDKPVVPLVSYDHWFGIGNGLNYDLLKAEAKCAAELGVETFAVDASWFPGGFPDGVGNWDRIDINKFPCGLEPLAEYVRELGMDFGLWFEPERAAEETTFIKQHPGWFIPVNCNQWLGRTKKQYYHLNLANSDAQDYLIYIIGEWIEKLDLRWSRWDYNIEPYLFWKTVDPTLKIQFDYLKGLYYVLDTLMKKYPNWMVEGCASGGRRIDIGMIKRSHTFWFSDQTEDPFICRYMQARANRFLPGHLLNSSIAVGFGQGDCNFNDTAALSRMLGKMAFDGDIASWSSKLIERMACRVNEFKSIRHLLVQDFYQLLPIPTTTEDWDAVQFISYSGDETILFVFSGGFAGCKTIPLFGLRPAGEYLVQRLPLNQQRYILKSEMLINGYTVEMGANEGGLWHFKLKG